MCHLNHAKISSMDITYTEDIEAKAAYLSFWSDTRGDIVSTLEYQQDKNIDFDADGNIVGIEFLSLPPMLDVSSLQTYVELKPREAKAIQDFLNGIAD
jgi:uncharacterized protein YuzE